jgi:predicted O-methyltransferase YrrM
MLPAASQTALPPVSEILDKYVGAIGGRAPVQRIKTSVRDGVFQVAPRTEFQVLIESADGGQWRMALTLAEDVRFEQVFDGKAGWEHTPDRTVPMDVKSLDSADPVFSQDVLTRPERYFAGFAMKGRENSGGREVWVLEGSRTGGASIRALFDVETGLLDRIGNVIVEDYRDVDGVKVAHRLRFVEKRGEQVMQFTRVRHNVPIPAAHFDKEQSGAAYRQAVREETLKALAKHLDGIDAGPARAVLERMHNFTAEDGCLLYDLIVKSGSKRGLEVGTAEGNSALWMGMAFRKNGGRLATIDRNAERTKVAVENFKQAGLAEIIDCRTADAFVEIPKIEGSFDFLFLDTGAPIHKKLLDLVYARLGPGALIVSHNANTLERMEPAFWKAVHEDPNLETTVTYTRGGGLLVARKKPQPAR